MGSTITFNSKKWNGAFQRTPHSIPEENNGPRLVEPGESLPTRVMIERMMDAGVRKSVHQALLNTFEFGTEENVPDGFINPLTQKSTDIIQVYEYKRWLEAKIRGQEEEAERIAAEAAAKKAEMAPVEPPVEPATEPQA